MFGIKTQLKKMCCSLEDSFIFKAYLTRLMQFFHADQYGHECNIEKADLGYGWIHYGLIRQKKPARILCIGSRHGYIPAILAQGCKDNGFGHVDFIDAGYGPNDRNAWSGEGYWSTHKGKNCFREFGLGGHITLFLTTTQDFSDKYPDTHYEYIYIDGDHSYRGVSLDFNLFFPRLSKEGYMVFHDICVKEKMTEGEYGVWKLWKRLEKKYGGIKVSYTGSGLGIIQKPS